MKRIGLFMMVLILLSAGCRYAGPLVPDDEAQDQPKIPRVKNPELAKLILAPKAEKLRVSRDPFKPLIDRSARASKRETAPVMNLQMVFLGTVKVGEEIRALVEVNDKKKFIGPNDVIQGYTVESLDRDQIIFVRDNQQKIIKRGDSR